jgi:membrane glycosyltransferase
MPKLAGLADVMLSKGAVARYGGPARFACSALVEIVVSLLMGAVTTFKTTQFMLGLAFGKSRVGWNGQERDAHGLSIANAAAALWPVTLFGIAVASALAVVSPTALAWSLPLIAGHLVAVPFAVVTASPAVGKWCVRAGLCAVPEDFDAPPEIAALRG